MNAFERHGLDHLSASSINLFAAQPALWAMEKLLGKRAPVGAAAHRGSAVEAGVEWGLFNPDSPLEECQEVARKEFARRTALSGDPRREKESEAIAPMVAVALGELRQYGVPEKPEGDRQHKIEISLDDVPVPFVGYLDFWYPDHGIVVDLKTQHALTSFISDPHCRQGAIYAKAKGNADIRMAYVTPKKIGVYSLCDAAAHLKAVACVAQCIERFLSLSDDRHALALALAPDVSSFYFNDSTARANAREVWGF
jgi:hypothetical protein